LLCTRDPITLFATSSASVGIASIALGMLAWMAAIHPIDPFPTDVANGRYGGMSCHRHRGNRAAAERCVDVADGV